MSYPLRQPILTPEPADLRKQASLARRLAAATVDPEISARLHQLADDYLSRADDIEHPARR